MLTVQKALTLLSALLVAAGGAVHLAEWNETYRDLPDAVPGAAVVKVGFPINASLSLLLAVALVVTGFALRRAFTATVLAAIVFQVGALAALVISRKGTLFGWQETTWTGAAELSKVLEVAAIVCLGVLLALRAARHRRGRDRRGVLAPTVNTA